MTSELSGYDVFISHASEDKDRIARPLAELLERLGLSVWIDEAVLKPGTSLSSSIDHGLAVARFGVVVLSPSFFRKNWPKYELSGLKARQLNGQDVILPIWHDVSSSEVLQFSPRLADMLAYDSSKQSLDEIAEGILQTVRPEEHSGWLVQRIRKALSGLGEAEYDGSEYIVWPGGGLRSAYHVLSKFATYGQVAKYFGASVWLQGPHSAQLLDLNNQYVFGHYNPAFVKWLRTNIAYVLRSGSFVRATEPIFTDYLLPIIRLHYMAYEYLRANEDVRTALMSDLSSKLATGNIKPHYYYELAWSSSSPSGDPWLQQNQRVKRLMDHLGESNWSAPAVYFWIRRLIDGTADLWFAIFTDLYVAYAHSVYFSLNLRTNWRLD